jgi:hypothetical protein
MSETSAPSARKERPRNGRDTRFKPKNAGKPVGAKDRRRVLGQAAAAALEGRCWDVLEGLLTSPSWRARHEAVKTTLGYALGLPRQTVTLAGGFADLSRELAAALAEARVRRATFDVPVPVAPLVTAPEAALALPAACVSTLIEAGSPRGAASQDEAAKVEIEAYLPSQRGGVSRPESDSVAQECSIITPKHDGLADKTSECSILSEIQKFNRMSIIGRCDADSQHLAPIVESRSEGEQVPEENKLSTVRAHSSAEPASS